MKKQYALLAALLLSFTVYSQKNFQDGYVVTSNGDTLKGQVNNLFWSENPTSITFLGQNGIVVYAPKDLQSFSAGEHTLYKSYNVKIDTTGGTGESASKHTSPTFFETHEFLRVIVEAEYSLLKYRKGFRTHFFIQIKNQVPEELISHAAQRIVGGQYLIQPGNQYILQLNSLLTGCKDISIDNKMKYLESSFIELFRKYNECKSSKVRIPGNEKNRTYFGPVVASHFDKFDRQYKGGVGYSAGIFFEVNFHRNLYRTSWYNELAFYRFGNQDATTKLFSQYALNERLRFEVGTMKLTSLVKSRILFSKSRPYLLGGVGKMFSSQNSKFYVDDKQQAGKIHGSLDAVLGFGLYLTKTISAELRAQRTLLVQFSANDPYNSHDGAGGPGCNSLSLSLAAHFGPNK